MKRAGRQFIETWTHYRYKETADIHLNKQTGEFSSTFGDHFLLSKSLSDIREQLAKLIESLSKLDWIPVIAIEINGNAYFTHNENAGRGARSIQRCDDDDDERLGKGNANLTLEFERMWMAKRKDGTWLVCDIWHSEDVDGKSDRYDSSKHTAIHDPMPRRLNAHTFYLHGDVKKFSIPFKDVDESFGDNKTKHYVRYTPQLWSGLNAIAQQIEKLKNDLNQLIGDERGLLLVEGLLGKLLPPARKNKNEPSH